MTYYKVLTEDGISPVAGFAWPLPKGNRPGRWVSVKGDLALCDNGVHAVEAGCLGDWVRAGSVVYEIELGGRVLEEGRKVCARKGRLVRVVGTVEAAARAEYNKVTAAAWAEYEKVTAAYWEQWVKKQGR